MLFVAGVYSLETGNDDGKSNKSNVSDLHSDKFSLLTYTRKYVF